MKVEEYGKGNDKTIVMLAGFSLGAGLIKEEPFLSKIAELNINNLSNCKISLFVVLQ